MNRTLCLPLIYSEFSLSYTDFSNLPWIYPKEPHGNLRNSKELRKSQIRLKVREQQEQQEQQQEQEQHDIDY